MSRRAPTTRRRRATGAFGFLGAVVLAGFLTAASVACGTSSARVPSSPMDAQLVVPGGEAWARLASVEDLFLLTGELRAVQSLELVTPRSEAWQVQIKWLADDGSELRGGDRAIEFDNSQVAQTIEEKKLRLIQTRIDLTSRRAAVESEGEDKRHALERARSALDKATVEAAIPQDILERRKWQEYQSRLRTTTAGFEKARLEMESFEVASKSDLDVLRIAQDKAARDLVAAQKELEGLAVKAPRDGIFVVGDYWREERKFQMGDTTWPGQTIASIPDLSDMEVIGWLSQVDDGQIAAGMPVRCILDTYPDRTFTGKIEEVASIAEEGGQRTRGGFRVRVSLEQSDPQVMRPGMSARIEIIRRSWDKALTIPRLAVHREKGQSFVNLHGASAPVEVRLVACTPIDCIVESGLSEGDRVLLR